MQYPEHRLIERAFFCGQVNSLFTTRCSGVSQGLKVNMQMIMTSYAEYIVIHSWDKNDIESASFSGSRTQDEIF